jgi:hypothetical protein
VWRQVIQATPWGTKPRHLLHDHDAAYGLSGNDGLLLTFDDAGQRQVTTTY